MFAKIVVGIDGSQAAEDALAIACDLAQKYDSELHLVHTLQPQTAIYAMGMAGGFPISTPVPSDEAIVAAAEEVITSARKVVEAVGGKITEVHQKTGEPADCIVDVAKQCGAGLIVTGRRGLGSLGALVQGSTSQRINHLADCAYLTVG